MFKDKKFSVQYTIDKRGRPISQTSSENLRKFYDLSSSEEDDEEGEEEEKASERMKKGKSKKYEKEDKKNKTLEAEVDSSSDNCVSSNGELLRIKARPKSDSDHEEPSESEAESESDRHSITNRENLKEDLKESKKQLHIKQKNQSIKLSHKVKEKLQDRSKYKLC